MITIEEIWKGVIYQDIDYSWRFECSNLGRIRNALNKHIYCLHKEGNGYLKICTSINGKRKNIKVHKAIAETFVENPYNFPIVNHKDGNKLNNCITNLEWVTYKGNRKHAVETGLLKNAFGENGNVYNGEFNGMAKLAEDDIIYIRENYIPRGKNQICNRNELAQRFNVTPQLIYKIYKREIWKHIK